LPPLNRILFRPSRPRVRRVEGGSGECSALARQIVKGGPNALRADVEAEK
jgi:hypothetical protein